MRKSGAFRSSIGKKILMAATGLILFVFVIGHLLGNLLIFAGPDAINGYAQKLRHMAPVLWSVRLLLLTALLLHIWTSVHLAIENRRARGPVGYRRFHPAVTSLAARTMMLSGLFLLAYLIYHLLHFTFRTAHPELTHALDPFGRHDVYAMVIMSFNNRAISLVYILGMAALCMHLHHGIASTWQTLGFADERSRPLANIVGRTAALLLFAGYSAIPLAVLTGFLTLG